MDPTGDNTAKNQKNKRFIRLADQPMHQMVQKIKERVFLNDQLSSTLSLRGTHASQDSMICQSKLQRVQSVGGFLKEIQQDRILKSHSKKVREWNYQATETNKKIFCDKRSVGTMNLNKLKSQNAENYQSVMMRDKEYIHKKQELHAIGHMREAESLNQNVGWIFTLRRNSSQAPRDTNQFHLKGNDIAALIVEKQTSVNELFWKHDLD